jgi:uncharacterized protein YqeY
MSSDPVQELVASVRADLRAAQQRRDRATMSPLREILSIVDNAGAVEARQGHDYTGWAPTEVPRREVTIDEVRVRLRATVTERHEAASTYRALEQHDHADELEREAAIIEGYLDGAP